MNSHPIDSITHARLVCALERISHFSARRDRAARIEADACATKLDYQRAIDRMMEHIAKTLEATPGIYKLPISGGRIGIITATPGEATADFSATTHATEPRSEHIA